MKKWKQHLMIAITLSIMFGLGWGIGLPATQALYTTAVRDTFSILFILLTAFQGLFIFIMRCARTTEIIKQWKRWLACVTRKHSKDVCSSAASGKAHRFRSSTASTTQSTLDLLSHGESTLTKTTRQEHPITASVNDESSIRLSHDKDENGTLKRNLAKSDLTSGLSTIQRMPMNIPEVIAEKEEAVELAGVESLEETRPATTFKLPPDIILHCNSETAEQPSLNEGTECNVEKGSSFSLSTMPLSISNPSVYSPWSETDQQITILGNPMTVEDEETHF